MSARTHRGRSCASAPCTGGHLVRADVYGRTFRTGGRVRADISYGQTRTGGRSVRADAYGSGSLDGRTWSKKYVFEMGVIPYHCVPCPSSLPLSHLIRVIISYPTPFTQHSLWFEIRVHHVHHVHEYRDKGQDKGKDKGKYKGKDKGIDKDIHDVHDVR